MEKTINLRYVGALIVTMKVLLVAFLVYKVVSNYSVAGFPVSFNNELLFFVFAGFIAQIIDGALGMAYGVSCSSLLLGFGLPPAAASASVHTSEVFTTGVSGLSHIIMGNIDKKL